MQLNVATDPDSGLEPRDRPLGRDRQPFEPGRTNPEISAALVALATSLDAVETDESAVLTTKLRSGTAANVLTALTRTLGSAHAELLVDWLSEPDRPERRAVLDSLLLNKPIEPKHSIRSRILALNRRVLLQNLFHEARVVSLVQAARQFPETQ